MNISLCLIAKNEEKKISKCIESAKHLVNDIIVVDTGSTDNTVQIAKEYGAKVFYYEWIKDFSAARNYAIGKCRGDWIIFLDADEYISDISKKSFMEHIKAAHKLERDAILMPLINIEESTKEFQSITTTIRIFRNRPSIRYKGALHERLHNATREMRLHGCNDEMKIFHTGYSLETVLEKSKSQRNLEILYHELEQDPTNANTYFYLIESLYQENGFEEALGYTYEIDKYDNGTTIGIKEKTIYHRLKCMLFLKKDAAIILEEYNKAIAFDSKFPDYEGIMIDFYRQNNNIDKTIEHLKLAIYKISTYDSIVESWIVAKVQELFETLADLYIIKGNKQEAVKTLVNILNADKYHYPCLHKLVNVLNENEKSLDIFNFLTKLYDVNELKDKIYLLKATRELPGQFIYNMVYNLLTEEEKSLYTKNREQ